MDPVYHEYHGPRIEFGILEGAQEILAVEYLIMSSSLENIPKVRA